MGERRNIQPSAWGSCDKAGGVLERVCGDARDVLCHQLKAVLVPGVAQLMCFTWYQMWGEDGVVCLTGKHFPGVLLHHCINSCSRR